MQLVCIRTLPLGRESVIVIIIVTDMHAQMLQSCMGAAAQRGGSESTMLFIFRGHNACADAAKMHVCSCPAWRRLRRCWQTANRQRSCSSWMRPLRSWSMMRPPPFWRPSSFSQASSSCRITRPSPSTSAERCMPTFTDLLHEGWHASIWLGQAVKSMKD
jgi:hypothetical protein